MNQRIIRIEEFEAPELDVYARLTENQLLCGMYTDGAVFIAESPKVVIRALDAGYEPLSFLIEEKHLETQAKEIIDRCPEVPVYTATWDVLKNLTGIPLTRGMLSAMKRKPLPSLKEVCEGKRRIAVLEDVANPTNVGAIVRSAAALHMDAVIFAGSCSNPLYRRAIRVSMGTIFQTPWTIVGEHWMEELKDLGFETVAMALKEDSMELDDPVIKEKEKLAVILGSEGYGLSEETLSKCDMTVMIPMSHGVDSLNVAAASAVAFWELGK